jgi:hypothetical protein
LSQLTRANWKVDKHIIASLKTKKIRTTGLKNLFMSDENLKNIKCITVEKFVDYKLATNFSAGHSAPAL